MNNFTYVILGAGRQGSAAAYDLALFGQTKKIILADSNQKISAKSAARINKLVGKPIAESASVDVTNTDELIQLLSHADSALSAVPYKYNLAITQAAIKTKTHFCDMGGFTPIVKQQLAYDEEAKMAGISIVPDCGMGPGLINTMGAYAIEMFDEPEDIFIYDAGLPQNPVPPWNYELTFHINGLTNEMDGQAVFIRNGEIAFVNTLTEPELMDVPPFGILEADVTSGGTSTAPWSFRGRIKTYENKVFRYPGHFEWLRAYKTLGLFALEPITLNGQNIVPRDVYHTLLEPKITTSDIRDIGIIRVIGLGKQNKTKVKITIDLIDYYDDKTGFTAMERLTGWHCSVMMAFQTNGAIKAGAVPQEVAISPRLVMDALTTRGIKHTVQIQYLND
jgi:lysine 6-dehydrogenase